MFNILYLYMFYMYLIKMFGNYWEHDIITVYLDFQYIFLVVKNVFVENL